MNKIIITGRLGRDPETSYTPKGTAVSKFSIAVDDGYGDYKRTDWFNVVVWAKTAEIAAEYLKKGSKVLIEGSMQYQEYEKDGEKKGYWNVNVGMNGRLEFLDSKPSGGDDSQTQRGSGRPRSGEKSQGTRTQQRASNSQQKKDAWEDAPSTQIQDEDIPF